MEDAQQQAEDLRLRGNDAFGTGDYERAIQLYEESAAIHPQAKTYSNLAACLCKLGNYADAEGPAERATSLDPKWAKGWWRRGVVAELLEKTGSAHSYFAVAVELSPKEKTFRKALRDIQKSLGIKRQAKFTAGGYSNGETQTAAVMETHKGGKSVEDSPSGKAIMRVSEMVGSNNLYILSTLYKETWPSIPNTEYPKTWQYFYQGSAEWYGGIMGAIALFSRATSREGHEMAQQFEVVAERNEIIGMDFPFEEETRLLGGHIVGQSSLGVLSNLVSGIACVGGAYLIFESGNPDRLFCSPGEILRNHTPYAPSCQMLGVLLCVEEFLTSLIKERGFSPQTLLVSDGVAQASNTFYANIRRSIPYDIVSKTKREQKPSPQECIDFIKMELQNGKTWDQIRPYISLMYRGTILFGFIMQTVARQVAISFENLKWAIDFINLADTEFSVSATGDYDRKGSAFRYSLRIGIMMFQLSSLSHLGNGKVHGPYNMAMILDLALEISEMAHAIGKNSNGNDGALEFQAAINKYAQHHKPLAMAHSAIASVLNTMAGMMEDPTALHGIVLHHHGLLPQRVESSSEDCFCDPYALIAKHYGIAAKNTLDDDDDASILWCGYAYAMCLSDPENQWENIHSDPRSTFTIGELREAIRRAEASAEARDVDLFGPQEYSWKSFETITRLTEDFFRHQDDSFVLPKVEIVRSGDKMRLTVDGEVICPNLHDAVNADNEVIAAFREKRGIPDDSKEHAKVIDKHGIDHNHRMGVIPSLETLCIRALHKSGCEYAKGETDGAIIQYKAMMAEAAEEETKATNNDEK